jgi:hypothetical protein
MKRLTLIVATVLGLSSPVVAADRLTDRDVKALITRIEQGRDKFDDELDGKLKNSVVRQPSGEANVKDVLNDFQESIDRVEERLKPEYAASAEVATLLRRGSGIEAFFRQQPPGTKGESEWNRLASDLKVLATAYGADFPLSGNATVRRIGDGELVSAVSQVAASSDQLKKSLDNDLKKDATISKESRQAAVAEADQMTKDAKALRDRVKDTKPSSAEASKLLAQAAKVQGFVDGHRVPASATAWKAAAGYVQVVANAYGTAWPR